MAEFVVASGDAAGLKTVIETTAVAGDKVIVPRGAYDFSGIGKVTINKELEIAGEGRQSALNWGAAASHGFELAGNVALGNVKIQRLALTATFGSGNPLDGISYANDNVANHLLTSLTLEDLLLTGWRNGAFVLGAAPNGVGSGVLIRNCEVVTNRTRGIRVELMGQVRISQNKVTGAGQNGIYVNECLGLRLDGNEAGGNNTLNGSAELGDAQTAIAGCDGFVVSAHAVGSMPTAGGATKKAVVISDCRSGEIYGVSVVCASLLSDNFGVRLISSTRGVRMGALGFTNVPQTNTLTFDATCAPALMHAWTSSQHAIDRA